MKEKAYAAFTCWDFFVLSLVISVIENKPVTQKKCTSGSVRINIS